ncbi:hypothetical protein L226DRAFT_616577 [Lentinus tigrinus ALCF2SS1-7]|uniref:uncharacterized protein n=1 Tax=Lentinus tigrinus ALCF2SS1-7 TaxID=1328758 RepID=UPI0011660D2B|nr:hypothetical protein L226DRAFT_616577 [Lentinus tigrinus ALCF2SS1-7]
MSNSSRSHSIQHERHARRTEALAPRSRTSDRAVLLGQPKAAGLPLSQLLTCPSERLRDRIANYDDPVQRLLDSPHLILKLNVTWPGHTRPEIEASKRLQCDGCRCLGQLSIEVAKECQETLNGWEKDVEPSIGAKRVLDVENLTLVALYYVEEPDGRGAYYADIESAVRE